MQIATLDSCLFSRLAGVGKRPDLPGVIRHTYYYDTKFQLKICAVYVNRWCACCKKWLKLWILKLRNHLKKPYPEGHEIEEGGKNKYLSLDGKSLKKLASVWSPRNCPCEVCGKTSTH